MFIYIASPYTSNDPLISHQRFIAAECYVAECLVRKEWVYSPIVHCHELARKFNLPKNFEFWKAYNYAMLSNAAALRVLMLPDWRMSKGVAAELRMAERCSIPVTYVAP